MVLALFGEKGLLTMLRAYGVSDSSSSVIGQGNYSNLGWDAPFGDLIKCSHVFDIYIPNGFNVTNAFLSIKHLPYSVYSGDTHEGYGAAKNIKFYKTDYAKKLYIVVQSDSGGSQASDNPQEINILGTNGFSAATPTNDDGMVLTTKTVSIPAENFTSGEMNSFTLTTDANTPTIPSGHTGFDVAYLYSGAVISEITLIGFMEDISY